MATTLIFVIFVGGHWLHRIFHTPLLLLKLKSSIKGEGYNFKVHKMGIEYITKWLVNPGLNNKHLFIFRADLTISAAWHYPPFSQNLQLQTLLVHQTSPTDIIDNFEADMDIDAIHCIAVVEEKHLVWIVKWPLKYVLLFLCKLGVEY